MSRRLVLHCVFIALPALVLCVTGVYFLLDKVPNLARAQKSAVTRQYREVAEQMLRDPNLAPARGPRQKGWRQTGKFDRQVPWGHVRTDRGELVWVGANAEDVAQAVVSSTDVVDVAHWLYFGVPAMLLIILAMTGVGIWFFVRYSRERDDFLAATAHDLTTPLVAMRRLIGSDDEYARTLNERMLRLVKNVTDFLKLGGRRPAPETSRFAIGAAFFEAYHVFADDYLEEKSGPVKVLGDTALEVSADKMLTTQILWNLLGNDLKYAAPYGDVTVQFSARGAMVDIAFVDCGPGMTARQRRRAFDRYFRARTVMQSGKGGFGIGLCTAREFACAMGGDLTLSPNHPQGCIFTLSLPAHLG